MPYIYLDGDNVLNCTLDDEGGGVEVSKYEVLKMARHGNFTDFDYIDGEIVFRQVEVEERERIQALLDEKDMLEGVIAFRGFVWLIKREIAAGRMTKAELPTKAIEAYDRIQEIELELG